MTSFRGERAELEARLADLDRCEHEHNERVWPQQRTAFLNQSIGCVVTVVERDDCTTAEHGTVRGRLRKISDNEFSVESFLVSVMEEIEDLEGHSFDGSSVIDRSGITFNVGDVVKVEGQAGRDEARIHVEATPLGGFS